MSIILKGIDMPKASNEDCVAVIRSNGKVEVWQTGMKEFEAQAIQIPTPHGRLIDEDTLICRMDDSFRMAGLNGADYRKVKRWLKNARTILEAEERDDELKR